MLSVIFLMQANPTEKLYENSFPDPPKIVLNELFSLEKMIGEILNREETYYITGTLSHVFDSETYGKSTVGGEVILSSEIKAYYGRNYVEAYAKIGNFHTRKTLKTLQIYVFGDSQRSGDVDKNNVKINLKYKFKKYKGVEISGKLSNVTVVRSKESFFISGILRKQGATFGVNLIISKGRQGLLLR